MVSVACKLLLEERRTWWLTVESAGAVARCWCRRGSKCNETLLVKEAMWTLYMVFLVEFGEGRERNWRIVLAELTEVAVALVRERIVPLFQ